MRTLERIDIDTCPHYKWKCITIKIFYIVYEIVFSTQNSIIKVNKHQRKDNNIKWNKTSIATMEHQSLNHSYLLQFVRYPVGYS